jgi:RAMA domain-containing protein
MNKAARSNAALKAAKTRRARRHARQTMAPVLVREYLERVDGSILKEYRATVKQLIHRHGGVYALYKGDRLYYAGLAGNLMGRVNTHLKDRHARKWDRFSVYLTSSDDHIRPLEALLLRIADPDGNRVQGRLRGAKDLGRTLSNLMSDSDANRRARLIGGRFARRRRRANLSAVEGSLGLSGLLDRRMRLIATYKGQEYRASLLKTGRIRYDGKLYDSPSLAAKAIVGRPVSGWRFWRYRKGRANWVRLEEIRR